MGHGVASGRCIMARLGELSDRPLAQRNEFESAPRYWFRQRRHPVPLAHEIFTAARPSGVRSVAGAGFAHPDRRAYQITATDQGGISAGPRSSSISARVWRKTSLPSSDRGMRARTSLSHQSTPGFPT